MRLPIPTASQGPTNNKYATHRNDYWCPVHVPKQTIVSLNTSTYVQRKLPCNSQKNGHNGRASKPALAFSRARQTISFHHCSSCQPLETVGFDFELLPSLRNNGTDGRDGSANKMEMEMAVAYTKVPKSLSNFLAAGARACNPNMGRLQYRLSGRCPFVQSFICDTLECRLKNTTKHMSQPLIATLTGLA